MATLSTRGEDLSLVFQRRPSYAPRSPSPTFSFSSTLDIGDPVTSSDLDEVAEGKEKTTLALRYEEVETPGIEVSFDISPSESSSETHVSNSSPLASPSESHRPLAANRPLTDDEWSLRSTSFQGSLADALGFHGQDGYPASAIESIESRGDGPSRHTTGEFVLSSRQSPLPTVPLAVKVGSLDMLSDDQAENAILTARPGQFSQHIRTSALPPIMIASGPSISDGTWRASKQYPVTASPTTGSKWRHPSLLGTLSLPRSQSCPSCKPSSGQIVPGISNSFVSLCNKLTPSNSISTSGDIMNLLSRSPDRLLSPHAKDHVSCTPRAFRRSRSVGSKRSTFGSMAHLYHHESSPDSRPEHSRSLSSRYESPTMDSRHRSDARYCPSGPASAHTSPGHGPITDFDDFGHLSLPASVAMTPARSLDEAVDAIFATSTEIRSIKGTRTENVGKDGPVDYGLTRHGGRSSNTSKGDSAVSKSQSLSVVPGRERSGPGGLISEEDDGLSEAGQGKGPARTVKGGSKGGVKDPETVCSHSLNGPSDRPSGSRTDTFAPSPSVEHIEHSHVAAYTPSAHIPLDRSVDADVPDVDIHSTLPHHLQKTPAVGNDPSKRSSSSTTDSFRLSATPISAKASLESLVLSTPLDPPSIVSTLTGQTTTRTSDDSRGRSTLPCSPAGDLARSPALSSFSSPPPQAALPPTPSSTIDRSISRRGSLRAPSQIPYTSPYLTPTQGPIPLAPSPTPTFGPLLSPFASSTRRSSTVSCDGASTFGSETSEVASTRIEESNMALQVDIRTGHQPPSTTDGSPCSCPVTRPGHLKQPSVPYSTRSSYSPITPTLETPTSHYNRTSFQSTSTTASARRLSRFTATSSSGSSVYCTDSEVAKIYRLTEKPDISTVYEEDTNMDNNGQRNAGAAPGPSRQLRQQASYSSLVSTQYPMPPHRSREGAISSSFSNRSDSSRRPLMLATSQSLTSNVSSLLHVPPPALLPSRSSPNLRALAKEGQAPAHSVRLAEDEDSDDDELCPVCTESLNASYKLPGEKPHVVPECGHALHEGCFVHVYGDVPSPSSSRNVGVCGVCRQQIKIIPAGKGKKSKGKQLTGEGDLVSQSSSSLSASSHRDSISSRFNLDDPVVPSFPSATRKASQSDAPSPKVIIPTISIRPETSTMNAQKGSIAAMISIQVPSAGERMRYPKPGTRARIPRSEASTSPGLPPSPISVASAEPMLAFAAAISGAAIPIDMLEADLKRRIQEYAKSSIAECGPLRMFEHLDVRKPNEQRTFLVYLFSDALACFSEEGPSGLAKMFKAGGTLRSKTKQAVPAAEKTLKLRGRIHFKHVRSIVDSSSHTELCLTLTMIDEKQPNLTLGFKNKQQYEHWRKWLNQVLKEWRDKGLSSSGGNSASKVAKIMGPDAPMALRRSPGMSTSASVPAGLGLASPFGTLSSPSMSSISHPAESNETTAQPLGPMHTPLDLVLVVALPATSITPSTSAPLKARLMRQSINFVLATLGPMDRVSLVSCEHGVNIRKTPLLCTTRASSRRRLEQFIEGLGAGSVAEDEFEHEMKGTDEHADLVTSINVSLDILLNRTARNPLSGLVIISDTSEIVQEDQLELVQARLESLNIPIHTFGYGKTHNPLPLQSLADYTRGTYTFVREWYHLRDAIAGALGGLLSIAITKVRISLSCSDNDFRIARDLNNRDQVASTGANTLDLELHDLRFGETREYLLEFTYDPNGTGTIPSRPNTRLSRMSTALSMDKLSLAESSSVVRDMVLEGRMMDDIPVVEVDCSYHDPAANKTVSRLTQPLLLTIPLISAPPKHDFDPRVLAYDPVVKRRRMEILAAEFVQRALGIMNRTPGRSGAENAEKILDGTRGIFVQTIRTLSAALPQDRPPHSRKEILIQQSLEMLNGVLEDLEGLIEALWENEHVFGRDYRNVAYQQMCVWRNQKSWTTKSATDRMYCTDEVREFIQLAGEWAVKS